MDPLVENFHWVNPYNYAENEPIAHIDLWGLQKMKPNLRPSDNLGELLYNMPYNVYRGAKVALREYFSKETGNGFKTAGTVIEYGGYMLGMTGHAEVAGPMIIAGKTLSVAGMVFIGIDEIIEEGGPSNDTYIDVGTTIVTAALPKPFEKAIDNIAFDNKAANYIFKSHRNAVTKAVVDAAKDEVIKPTINGTDSSSTILAENSEEICVESQE